MTEHSLFGPEADGFKLRRLVRLIRFCLIELVIHRVSRLLDLMITTVATRNRRD